MLDRNSSAGSKNKGGLMSPLYLKQEDEAAKVNHGK